jgi:hypothetical protein
VGRIGLVIKHEIEKFIKIIAETRKAFNETVELYNSSGVDAPPCKKDRVFLVQEDGTGKFIVVGALTKSRGAKPGEVFIFSRDADGALQSLIKMLNNGTVDTAIKKDLIVKADADVNIEAKKKNTIKGAEVEINGMVKATGGSFECNGNVTPTGMGALCGCKYCYVTASPVAGNKAEGT